jgi:hypothetical protein
MVRRLLGLLLAVAVLGSGVTVGSAVAADGKGKPGHSQVQDGKKKDGGKKKKKAGKKKGAKKKKGKKAGKTIKV